MVLHGACDILGNFERRDRMRPLQRTRARTDVDYVASDLRVRRERAEDW